MSAYATALRESSREALLEEALRQHDRADQAEEMLERIRAENKRLKEFNEEMRDGAMQLREVALTLGGRVHYLMEQAATEIRILRDWKTEVMAVEAEWDAQKIASMLGGRPGASCRKVIAEKVPQLITRADEAERALQREKEHRRQQSEFLASTLKKLEETDAQRKR